MLFLFILHVRAVTSTIMEWRQAQAFMTTKILLGMDFTNLKQYYSSKWLKFYWMVVNWLSLMCGAFSWTILENFHNEFSIGFHFRLLAGHLMDDHIIIIIIYSLEIFTSVLVDGLSLEFEWQQVSSSLQDFSQYSSRSQ